MKQGSSGLMIFGILVILAVGVQWVESRFGPEIAGFTVMSVFVLLIFTVLCLLALAGLQGLVALIKELRGILVPLQRGQSRVELQKERQETIRIKSEADVQKRIMQGALFLGRHIGANYKAQIAAQHRQEEPETIDLPNDRYSLDMSDVDYGNIEIPE